MIRIDGKKIAEKLYSDISHKVHALSFRPVFCDIVVGDDKASLQYVTMKEKRARDVGMDVHHAHFPNNITTDALVSEIIKINTLPHMCGLIVQLPLPEHIDTQVVLDAIDPAYDVDVLHSTTSEPFYSNDSDMIFPTARAVMHVLESIPIDMSTKQFLVIGQGRLVGRPVTHLLKNKGYAVETLDRDSHNTQAHIQSADIIISATGHDGLITGDMVKKGSIIIDAGTSESDGGIKGDVDIASLDNKPAYISGVPGGVGPITVAMLLDNVVRVAQGKYSS